MPRCVINIARSEFHRDRPSPLTCRHRRRCNCDGHECQGQNGPAISVPKIGQSGPELFAEWNTEAGQLVLRTLEAHPAARDALVEAISRFLQAQPE